MSETDPLPEDPAHTGSSGAGPADERTVDKPPARLANPESETDGGVCPRTLSDTSEAIFPSESDGYPASATPPRSIGDHPILERLGFGGMGEVFLAVDESLDRQVALKRIRLDKASVGTYRQRFDVEARVTARLQHPSIIPVYEYDAKSDDAYYTMRPVEGMTLGELLRKLERQPSQRSVWPATRIVRLFLQATNAIAYAHSRGVIHRDLKPANVMIGPFEEVLVVDWGMAKFTDAEEPAPSSVDGLSSVSSWTTTGAVVGTPAYMAPEQFERHPADVRTEVFSLGVMLYELLALRLPWEAKTIDELRERSKIPPENPSLVQPGRSTPFLLGEVALRAIQHDRAERYATVEVFARDVAAALEGDPSWNIDTASLEHSRWKLADGRLLDGGEEVLIRSRGVGRDFRYFCTRRLEGSVRLEFDLGLRKGASELSVWLNAELDAHRKILEGYRLNITNRKQSQRSLFRSGREVTGGRSPDFVPGRWYHVVAERTSGRITLRIDGEEIYSWADPIPLTGGFIGFSGQTGGLLLRELRVSTRGTPATVSCLAVPDAFFNRGHYEDARVEYAHVAASHPGRSEAHLATFRSGLCLLELYRQEDDIELKSLLLDDARQLFVSAEAQGETCLAALGSAMVATESGDFVELHESLTRALNSPDDPQRHAVNEWILGRLHVQTPDDRLAVAELLPLALAHCMETWGRRSIANLVRSVRGQWETPSFMSSRGRFRENDFTSRAEAILFFSFWTGRGPEIRQVARELLSAGLARPHHASDAIFSLLELGELSIARDVLTDVEHVLAASSSDDELTLESCRAGVAAAEGRVDEAEEILDRLAFEPSHRSANSARLWLARSLHEHGDPSRAARALKLRGDNDTFAREHLAWFALLDRDTQNAREHLSRFVTRGDHLNGRNLSGFLVGALRLLERRRPEALEHFGRLPKSRHPRTWTLGAHLLTGELGAVESFNERSFPWERRVLQHHLNLVRTVDPEHALGI
ncbi:MAG: protein kinase [Planctomycetota bacterium]